MTSVFPLLAAIHRAVMPFSFLALTSAPLSSAAVIAFSSPARTAAQSASRASVFGSAAGAVRADDTQRITRRENRHMRSTPWTSWHDGPDCTLGQVLEKPPRHFSALWIVLWIVPVTPREEGCSGDDISPRRESRSRRKSRGPAAVARCTSATPPATRSNWSRPASGAHPPAGKLTGGCPGASNDPGVRHVVHGGDLQRPGHGLHQPEVVSGGARTPIPARNAGAGPRPTHRSTRRRRPLPARSRAGRVRGAERPARTARPRRVLRAEGAEPAGRLRHVRPYRRVRRAPHPPARVPRPGGRCRGPFGARRPAPGSGTRRVGAGGRQHARPVDGTEHAPRRAGRISARSRS